MSLLKISVCFPQRLDEKRNMIKSKSTNRFFVTNFKAAGLFQMEGTLLHFCGHSMKNMLFISDTSNTISRV